MVDDLKLENQRLQKIAGNLLYEMIMNDNGHYYITIIHRSLILIWHWPYSAVILFSLIFFLSSLSPLHSFFSRRYFRLYVRVKLFYISRRGNNLYLKDSYESNEINNTRLEYRCLINIICYDYCSLLVWELFMWLFCVFL